MVKSKICMLGAFSVGKTSLVSRFVHSMFSDKYLTTVGVKIDKKVMNVDGRDQTLLVWDIYGEDDVQAVNTSYMRGMAGYLLIVDGTRPDTLRVAARLRSRVEEHVGDVPFVLLLNKCDLTDDWQLNDGDLDSWRRDGGRVVRTSARSGEGVEAAFTSLARAIVGGEQ